MPKKAFWLAPERQETARRMIVSFALRFGILLQMFVQAVSILAAQANLRREPGCRRRSGCAWRASWGQRSSWRSR